MHWYWFGSVLARENVGEKPRFLGSHRGTAALFFRPAALGHFWAGGNFSIYAFAKGAWGTLPPPCVGIRKVPRTWVWFREMFMN